MKTFLKNTGVAVAILTLPGFLFAQEAAKEAEPAEELAKKLSNPVAAMVSVPLQFNWDNGVGVNDDVRFTLNLQPVVPIPVHKDWNLIARWILPFMSQPVLTPGGSATSGTGDILTSAFFSPAEPGAAIWGIGPVFGLPTSSDPALSSGQWSAGPTALVLKQAHGWTVGALVNHLWSLAETGDAARGDVNLTYMQPFLSFTTKKAMTIGMSSETSYNWEGASSEKWTAPILANISQIIKFGPFPFSIGVGGGYYIDQPTGGPEWKLRTTFTLILPQAKG